MRGGDDDDDSSLGGEKENVEAAVKMQKDTRVIGDTIETSNAKHDKGMGMANVAATNLFMLMPTDAQEETYFIKMYTSAKSNAPEADADNNIASQEKQDKDVNVVEASQLSMRKKRHQLHRCSYIRSCSRTVQMITMMKQTSASWQGSLIIVMLIMR